MGNDLYRAHTSMLLREIQVISISYLSSIKRIGIEKATRKETDNRGIEELRRA
jgi:hypothetical protein